MKKNTWWIIGIAVVVLILLAFGGGMMTGGWGYRGYGMMGGNGMMGWGYSPFGGFGMGLGMIFMWLIPIGIVALIVYGIVALARNNGNLTPPASQTACPNCGKGVLADWNNCPHCGTSLK